jgi:N-acetylmuramoyl-L-alanine amidase
VRTITEISVHCAASRPSWMAGRPGTEKVAEMRRWHMVERGWSDIGYHYVIDRDGQVYTGRPIERSGALVNREVNERAAGICLIGGHGASTNDAFEDHYTSEQDVALRQLIAELRAKYPSIKRVSGHNEYANKACPGFNVARWLAHKPPERPFVATGTAAGAGSATVAATGLAVVEVLPILTETRTAVTQAAETPPTDPIRWVLLAVVLAGAAYALWRRWRDYRAGHR